jgi:hypothetical protein
MIDAIEHHARQTLAAPRGPLASPMTEMTTRKGRRQRLQTTSHKLNAEKKSFHFSWNRSIFAIKRTFNEHPSPNVEEICCVKSLIQRIKGQRSNINEQAQNRRI